MDAPRASDATTATRTIHDKYMLDYAVGAGTYGVVYRARRRRDNTLVAVKKFEDTLAHPEKMLTALREINLLHELRYEKNSAVVRLEDVLLDRDKHTLWLVFEWCEIDLHEVIQWHRLQREPLHATHIKHIMKEILRGLAFLHNNWIIHRDVKPSNVLVVGPDAGERAGGVRMADFGLARVFQDPLRPLADDGIVVTYRYRAPELLLLSKHYTRAVDIWAAGCIFGELLLRQPLFAGKENISKDADSWEENQFHTILHTLGAPNTEDWPELSDMPAYDRAKPLMDRCRKQYSQRWFTDRYRSVLPHNQLELLNKLLQYNPTKRLSADEALKHAYFSDDPPPARLSVARYPLRAERNLPLAGKDVAGRPRSAGAGAAEAADGGEEGGPPPPPKRTRRDVT